MNNQSPLRVISIYRAFSRPQLIIGCEREPVLLLGVISFALIFSGVSLVTTIVGISLWVITFPFLRKIAKADPQMSKIYLRHIKYKSYYPAKSTPFAPGHISKTQ